MEFDRNKIKAILDFIRKKTDIVPSIGIICGSGLIPDLKKIKNPVVIPFSEIPRFPTTSVTGHKGRFVFGGLENKKIVIQEGRIHYYEGLPFDVMLLPLYLIKNLGIKTALITNAAGGVNPGFKTGDIMLVKNHINLMGVDPLVGKFKDDAVSRFIDMRTPYDEKLISLAIKCAKKLHIPLREGVYMGDTGPHYETEAEVAAFRKLGADAVGMSLVPESIFARYLGIDVMALSVITNIYKRRALPLSHDEVVQEGARSANKVFKLLTAILKELR